LRLVKFWLSASVGVWLQLGLALPSSAVEGVNSVEQLLAKLSHTLQERNYRGLFTYEYGGTLDTLEIIHLVRDGVEYERLQHLSGPTREIVRSGRGVNCVNTAAQLLRGGLFSQGEKRLQLHQYYNFTQAGDERVADRLATVVRLTPKDQYRYGLILSVDKATGFPMKTLVVNNDHQVLERIQFVELDLEYDPGNLPLKMTDTGYVAVSTAQDSCTSSNPVSAASTDASVAPSTAIGWRPEWVPRGFVLSEHVFTDLDGHHLVYTDGLASFSVFIKSVDEKGPAQPSLARHGATVALMLTLPLKKHPADVTVVGEIPAVTAEQVALGVRSVQSGEAP
jgi:sigma-E factor negative regulatory protein RseB